MRKIVSGASIIVAILLFAAMYGRLPNSAEASSHAQMIRATDAYAIESTIDVKALPRHDTLSEADE
jgi:hypothetical protein